MKVDILLAHTGLSLNDFPILKYISKPTVQSILIFSTQSETSSPFLARSVLQIFGRDGIVQ